MEKVENMFLDLRANDMFATVTFDWIRFTFKSKMHFEVIEQIANILEIPFVNKATGEYNDLWQECNGSYNYKYGLKFDIGFNERSIFIFWDNINNSESIMLEMSGSCCRWFDNYCNLTYVGLFARLKAIPEARATRIDVCADDTKLVEKSKNIDIKQLEKKLDKKHFENHGLKKKRTHDKVNSKKYRNSYDEPIEGTTLYIGSRKAGSQQFLRIYDKQAEQLAKGIPCEHEKWIRYEMVYAGDKANDFIALYIQEGNIGRLYAENLNHFITFTTGTGKPWQAWERLIKTVSFTNIPTKRKDIRIMDKIKWMETNASKNFAICAYAKGMTFAEYGEYLGKMGDEKITKLERVRIEEFIKENSGNKEEQ